MIEQHLKRFEMVVVRFMQLHYKLVVLVIPFVRKKYQSHYFYCL